MDPATTVLDLVPANKVPPAPVLPRLPLHLLKKNDETSSGAKKASGPLKHSKSLEGAEKGEKAGKAKQVQRRSSEAALKQSGDVKGGIGRRKSEGGEKVGALKPEGRKVGGSKLRLNEGMPGESKGGAQSRETGKSLSSTSKVGAPSFESHEETLEGTMENIKEVPESNMENSKNYLQANMGSSEVLSQGNSESSEQGLRGTHEPTAQPSTYSISTIASSIDRVQLEESAMHTESSGEDTLQSGPSDVDSNLPNGTEVEMSAGGRNSDNTDQYMLGVGRSEEDQSPVDSASEMSTGVSHKQDKPRPRYKSTPPTKPLPVSRFASPPKPASLPEAQVSIARTLDWDFENQSELVLGQASASFQSADFLDGALSRFAGLKVEPRNPLHQLGKVGSALMARQRGLQQNRFGRPPSSARSEAGEVLLDGFLLCDAAGVELPEEAEVVNLCGSHLTSVETNDMRFFERLSSVNAADNYLKMECFTGLASLTRLLLPCNKLESLRFLPGHFQTLEVLDVSFNHLTRTDLSVLSTLPRLLELYFDHNRLSGHLPADAFLPGRFHRLQKLSLSANGLPSSSLTSLSKLPCLRSLSLGRNPIQRIPPESVSRDARAAPFPCLTELDLAGTRIAEAESALGLVHLSKTLRRIALWETPLAVRAGSDGNGEPLESALPILAAAAEAADRGQRWLLTKSKPRAKPELFGAQLGTTVEELSKEHLADLAAAYPEMQLIAALERVQKRFELPVEATGAGDNALSRSPQESFESLLEEGAVGAMVEPLDAPGDEEPGTTERELYQLANAPTPAGGLPHIDDTSAAVLALKYALKHPLVKTNPVPEHHQQLNTLAKIRLEDSIRRKVPLSPTRELTRSKIEETIQEAKKEEVAANIEDILSKMKARLNQVEKKLKKAGHGKV